jgi:hypothetical protein
MSINSVNGTMNNQMYQLPAQKSGGKIVQQPQPAAVQGPSEESKESAAAQSKEASKGTEGMESKSINLYA